MTIDLCIENAGWVAQFVEANVAYSFFPLRHGSRNRPAADKTPVGSSDAFDHLRFDQQAYDPAGHIRSVAADLPIDQAAAIWLVDVCGCTYDAAAAAMEVSRDDLAAAVTEARQTIRTTLASPAS